MRSGEFKRGATLLIIKTNTLSLEGEGKGEG
jgi:hypothetical protein